MRWHMKDDPESEARVDYMIKDIRRIEENRHQYAIKHGFAWKRPQDFKNCIVIYWRYREKKNKPGFIDYERIDEYVAVAHAIRDKYNLFDERHPLQDAQSYLSKIGIHSGIYTHTVWAIPNEHKELQDYVLSILPPWADAVRKKVTNDPT